MARIWEAVHSFFAGEPDPNAVRVAVVALVVSEQDRRVIMSVSGQQALDVYFAKSSEEAGAAANRLTAPVVLFDRDWPGTEWRTAIERLSGASHRPCVILLSGVADDYLWQELIRQGGYDILPKPLRADNAARVVKLALSYWNSSLRSAPIRK